MNTIYYYHECARCGKRDFTLGDSLPEGWDSHVRIVYIRRVLCPACSKLELVEWVEGKG